jgi:hypothetical protein
VTDGRADIHWSPRVPKGKLKRLYEAAAQGRYDDELVDDVGMMLFMRCRDILRIRDAKQGRVVCPRCECSGGETVIRRCAGREELLRCPKCGWSIRWDEYQSSYKRRQLNLGGAEKDFEDFVREYRRARDARERMKAIDRLVHAFHYSYRDQPDQPTRPVGVNLIVGKLPEVIRFLDRLSGIAPDPDGVDQKAAWKRSLDKTWWPRQIAQEEKARRRRQRGLGTAPA